MDSKKIPTTRQHLIKLIHVAKRDLQLDDDTYRAILRAHSYGRSSCAEMSVYHLDSVLKYLKSKGFKVKSKVKQTRTLADDDQSRLIRRLWLTLHYHGAVRDPSERALCRYVKRLTRIDALQWISTDQAITVIESLKKWGSRYGIQWANKGL